MAKFGVPKAIFFFLFGLSCRRLLEIANSISLDTYLVSKSSASTSVMTATPFDKMTKEAFRQVYDDKENKVASKPFILKEWHNRTAGGLRDKDRVFLAKLYSRPGTSVFEYGVGESTYIADHVGVARYAGIDSDPTWVGLAREKVSSRFRFYLADVGPTGAWGLAKNNLTKAVYQYQLAPLIAEPEAFDVYMVDGRWRFACVLASFLHAADRGDSKANHGDRTQTTVLLHDCRATQQEHVKSYGSAQRINYHAADHLLRVEHSGAKLCIFHRLENTTDEQLLELWYAHNQNSQ
jgi:hypothetical protein